MPNLMDLLQGELGDSLLGHLSNAAGTQDRNQTSVAAKGAMNILMNALTKNASAPGGLSALSSALDRDHDGSILDDVVGMMAGQRQPQNTSMLNGAGILKHVLGGRQNNAIDMIAQMSGLNQNSSAQILTQLAPLVMGMIGKQKKQNNYDEQALGQFLNQSRDTYRQQNNDSSIIEKLLDRDGDGNVMDDIAQIGLKNLGRFFGK